MIKKFHEPVVTKGASSPFLKVGFLLIRQMNQTILVFSFLLLLTSGCDKNPLGTIDPRPNPPFLAGAILQPVGQNIDSLNPDPSGSYRVTTSVKVNARNASSVSVSVFRPQTGTPFAEFQLLDNGIGGDSVANDGIFSGSISYTLLRAQAGLYQMRVTSLNDAGEKGNELLLSFLASRANATPTLDSNSLVAPDTIDLPIGGQVLVLLTIASSDSDGIGDIREVAFTSLTSSTPSFKFQMRDDGGSSAIGPPFFLPSGDATAGDGIFSIVLPLVDGPTVRRTNIFSFKASDSFGAVSDSVVHFLTIQ